MRERLVARGYSREVFIREDGIVVKKPRYDSYDEQISCGSCDQDIFRKLIRMTKKDRKVQKFQELSDEGRWAYSACRNTFIEYMISLLMNEEEKKYFAVCQDIRIRRSPTEGKISIVGFYENAFKKKIEFEQNIGDMIFEERTGFEIDDLHSDNYIRNIIVDYACIG